VCADRNNLEHARTRFKQYYNRKANPQIFQKDDCIFMYIYIKESLRSKFDEQYKGLYKILEILENNNEN